MSETDHTAFDLRKAGTKDQAFVIELDFALNEEEHVKLNREEKLVKAIKNEECFIIMDGETKVGFMVLDYRFFDQGWIELLLIDQKHRGKGMGAKAMELICRQSKTAKVFTSTNRSNIAMQKALKKAGFSFAGEIVGLDEGDPERFYSRTKTHRKNE